MADNFKQEEPTIQVDLFGNEVTKKFELRDKYIEPPFSVFDTKQGTWQRQRNKWKKLGIESTSMILPMQLSASMGRTVSPIAGVLIATAEIAQVSTIAIVKRNIMRLQLISVCSVPLIITVL